VRVWKAFVSTFNSALLALFLAIVVWVVAVYQTSPPRADWYPEPIPLKVIGLGENLVIAGSVPSEVRLSVRALASTWEQLRPSAFDATIDMQGLGEGVHDVVVTVTASDRNATVVGVDPNRVTVSLEAIADRRIRVRVKVLDEESIPLGYVSRLPEVTPDQVAVRGPRSLVSPVTEAVIEISLRNARGTVTKQEAPMLVDSSGKVVEGLSITPATVTASVVVERQVGSRAVTVRAITRGSPAPGYWISNISVQPALVTVYGQQSVIEQLPGYLDTVVIDVSNASQDIIRRVALALPEGVLVLGEGAGPEGILVQISVQPLLGGQTIRREARIQNLRSGLKATASPLTLDIIVSGPLPALQSLKPDDVQVVIDLVGLVRGTHKVTPRVVLPMGLGLEVKSIVPDIVEVIIE